MTFSIPDDLAPEVYPLAWLLGTWRGEGVLAYPGIEETPIVQTAVVDHDGGPYLRYTSTIRTNDVAAPDTVPDDLVDDATGQGSAEQRASAQAPSDDDLPIWSTETGYWRVPPERPEGLPDDRFPVEVLLSDPAGHLALYLGAVGNGRIDLASDLIARTPSAAAVNAATRMYGLVEGRLLWVWEIAAFGHPLQSYVSASLDRQ
jgi:hypothetical protein